MPAYGHNLSPAEIEALISFLETLHPPGERPAIDAAQRDIEANPAPPPSPTGKNPVAR